MAMTVDEIKAIEDRFPQVFQQPLYRRFWPLFLVAGTILYLVYALWFFSLPQVLRDYPELKDVGRITLWQSFKCVNLSLWDEGSKKLISFREAHRMMMAGPAAA